MTVQVGSLGLPNPIMTAAGTAGHGAELHAYVDLASLGAVVVKSLSPAPWGGNPAPRVLPVRAGMMNSVGLQNPGLGAWLEHELPELAATGARVVVSVWGTSAADYKVAGEMIVSSVDKGGAAGSIVAVEANISCPNVEDRSRMFAHAPESTATAVAAVREGLSGSGLPLWVKLSPNVTDLVQIASAAVEEGADGLTLVNTLMGLALDPLSGRKLLGGGGGGLSGPALHPLAVRAVFDCRAALPQIPIIGVGGISSGEETAEMLSAGANAVQIGTATFAEPRACARVLHELQAWCAARQVARVADLVGRAHV